MATEKPKRNAKHIARVNRRGVFWAIIVALIFVVISVLKFPIDWHIGLNTTPDCDTSAGYQLAFASNSGIYLTDESTGQPNDIAEYPFPSTRLTWSPDGQWLAYREIDGDRQHIRVLNTSGALVSSVTFARDDDRGIHWEWLSDSQTMIVVAPVDDGWQLLRWQVGEDEAIALVNHESNAIPEWELSPDGTQITIIDFGHSDLLLVDSRDGNSQTVFEGTFPFAKVEWSHDGRYILLTNRDLYRITAADGAVTQLTSGVQTGFAHWSPDDSRIAYTHRGGLYVIPSEGGDAQQLVNNMVEPNFVWSPDGEWLLFTHHREERIQSIVSDIGVVHVDGSGFANTQNARSSSLVQWSADSQFIYYEDWDEVTGDHPVYIMTLSTGERFQASPHSGFSAIWSPDGRYVAVQIDNRLHLVEAATGERCIVHRDGSAYPYIWRPVPIDG